MMLEIKCKQNVFLNFFLQYIHFLFLKICARNCSKNKSKEEKKEYGSVNVQIYFFFFVIKIKNLIKN